MKTITLSVTAFVPSCKVCISLSLHPAACEMSASNNSESLFSGELRVGLTLSNSRKFAVDAEIEITNFAISIKSTYIFLPADRFLLYIFTCIQVFF